MALRLANNPPKLPIGVRTAETIKTSCIEFELSNELQMYETAVIIVLLAVVVIRLSCELLLGVGVGLVIGLNYFSNWT